jgi:hypothetical protein
MFTRLAMALRTLAVPSAGVVSLAPRAPRSAAVAAPFG